MYQLRVNVVVALIAILLASLQIVAGAPLFRSSGAEIDFTTPPATVLPLPGFSSVQRSVSSSVAGDERRTMAATLNYFIPEWMSSLAKRDSTKRTRSIRRRHHSGRHP